MIMLIPFSERWGLVQDAFYVLLSFDLLVATVAFVTRHTLNNEPLLSPCVAYYKIRYNGKQCVQYCVSEPSQYQTEVLRSYKMTEGNCLVQKPEAFERLVSSENQTFPMVGMLLGDVYEKKPTPPPAPSEATGEG